MPCSTVQIDLNWCSVHNWAKHSGVPQGFQTPAQFLALVRLYQLVYIVQLKGLEKCHLNSYYLLAQEQSIPANTFVLNC